MIATPTIGSTRRDSSLSPHQDPARVQLGFNLATTGLERTQAPLLFLLPMVALQVLLLSGDHRLPVALE